MLKTVFKYHLIPILVAALFSVGIVNLTSPLRETVKLDPLVIKGKAEKNKGVYYNLRDGNQAEVNYLGSIMDEEQITIFGSSEFGGSPIIPYNFLADSFGVKILGLGHAYHQHLSILIELLAASAHLEKTKICIILSHHWFKKGKGTNPQAFLEFARPHFLDKIANDTSIEIHYKNYIGAYIHRNESSFSFLSPSMKYFMNLNLKEHEMSFAKLKSALAVKIMNRPNPRQVNYQIEHSKMDIPIKKKELEWERLLNQQQAQFKNSVTNNGMWISNDYFNNYVKQENGDLKSVKAHYIDPDKSEEFEDFQMLLTLIKERNINCSFIIQPLNPYYYTHLHEYNDLTDQIIFELEENQIPYLNLFVSDKESYEPGLLNDVMHLGDYGWMKINRFLYQQYVEN